MTDLIETRRTKISRLNYKPKDPRSGRISGPIHVGELKQYFRRKETADAPLRAREVASSTEAVRKEGSRRPTMTPAIGEFVDRVSHRLRRVQTRTPRVQATLQPRRHYAGPSASQPGRTRAQLFYAKNSTPQPVQRLIALLHVGEESAGGAPSESHRWRFANWPTERHHHECGLQTGSNRTRSSLLTRKQRLPGLLHRCGLRTIGLPTVYAASLVCGLTNPGQAADF
ncbi:hypothetical protein HPB48_012631 [Haemaphysalis longicornis]|uniref:Uncharacterized protein n=1 Tax=Haemaphysalis longicornis TaxID=44386 RepID=A0A9J6G057_HAELO|nr:hypothetical protein HPB48_012631 [Haemaphysalis longicornis]